MSQMQSFTTTLQMEHLLKRAGKEAYDKGQALLPEAKISELNIEEDKASARINQFKVRLHYHGANLDGNCNCSESEGFDFCEHCVVLSLLVNKQSQKIRSLAKGPDKSKVLAYLLNLDKHELAKQFLGFIIEDPHAFEQYLWKAFLHQGEIDYTYLKSHITQLTRKPDNLFSQRQVKVFFQKLERFLAELAAEDAPSYEPEKILKVIDYAFHRLNSLLAQLEDTNDYCAQSAAYLRQLHADAFPKQVCREETMAKRFYALWLTDRFDLLGKQWHALFSAKGLGKFNDLVQSDWKTLTAPSKNKHKEPLLKNWQQLKLARYLFEEAIQSGQQQKADYYRNFLSKDSNHDKCT